VLLGCKGEWTGFYYGDCEMGSLLIKEVLALGGASRVLKGRAPLAKGFREPINLHPESDYGS
jgi:hypothetical protein